VAGARTRSTAPAAAGERTFAQGSGVDSAAEFDFLAPPQLSDEIGRLGPYRVLQVLGVGGMGVVFLAEDTTLKRRVALKTMKPALAVSDVQRRRFLREAESTAAVEHDHIVSIYQVGEADGVPYFAMQLLKGRSLDDRLKGEPLLPIPDVLRIGREMADGLTAAHEKGLIHRDIKPANVWLEDLPSGRWRVKLVDFGLARDVTGNNAQLTAAGFVVGTPAFMSPEQAKGQPVDARGDLFSLGCVLYRLSTGKPPFKGKDVISTLVAVGTDTPARPRAINPGLPQALDDLVMRLLAKSPADRPVSAQAVAAELTAINNALAAPIVPAADAVQTTPALGQKSSPAPRLVKTSLVEVTQSQQSRRSVWPLAAAAALLVAVLGAGAVLFGPDLFSPAPSGPGPDAQAQPSPPATRPTALATRSESVRPPPPAKPGVLVIETIVPKVEVVIKQKGKTVREHTADRRFELPPGEYDVSLAHGIPNLEVAKPRVTLKEGLQETVRVHWVMVVPRRGEPLSAVALVSQPVPVEQVQSWTLETRGHRGPVRSLAYSPNGKWLATAGEDGTIRLWDPGSGKLERILVGQDNLVAMVIWSPDSSQLAARGGDGTIRLWDAESATPMRVLRPGGTTHGLAWSTDGKMLALAKADGLVHLYDAATGKPIRTLEGHTTDVRTVAFSPDGKLLASAGDDRTVRLWRLDDLPKSTALYKHDDVVTVLAWAPDSKYLASGSKDNTVRVWDMDKADAPRKHTWDQAPKLKPLPFPSAQSLAFIPTHKGRKLAALNNAGLTIWRPGTDKSLASFPMNGHTLAWSPDGKTIAVALNDDVDIRILDSETGKTFLTLPGHKIERIIRTSWSPDGKLFATVDEGKTIRLWESATGKSLHTFKSPAREPPTGLAWSPEGKRLATVCPWDSKVYLWDTTTGKPLPALTTTADSIAHAAWSSDGQTLAVGGDRPNEVFFFNMDNSQLKANPGVPKGGNVNGLAWMPDGKVLASYNTDGNIRFWDAAGKSVRTPIRAYNHSLLALAWSPDGRKLATSGGLATDPVKLWDAGSGKFIQEYKGHQAKIGELTFSPDGKTLIARTRSDDDVLHAWDLASSQLRTLTPPSGSEHLLSERGVGATSCPGMSLRLWDFETQRPLSTLLVLSQGQADTWFLVTSEGRFQIGVKLKGEVVYVAQTEQGQEVLPLEEFRTRYKFRPELDRIQLLGPPGK
jgi:WD40 repeat protein/serine/threonine protein kinase